MKILVADDHAIVRKGVISLLSKEFKDAEICEISSAADAISKARTGEWDLILLDISMPGRSGIEALKQIRADGIKIPILMLTMQPEDQYAVRVLKAGASGYVNKDCVTEELIIAVHRVLGGRKYISSEVTEQLATSLMENGGKTGHQSLSDREMQVLELMAAGKTLSEIGEEISLNVNTISTYRARILQKLELRSNAAIIRYAMDNKLI